MTAAVTPDIVEDGDKYILPKGTSLTDAITYFTRKKAENERVVNFNYEFVDEHPLEVLYAFNQTLEEVYGWVDIKATVKQGLFGPTQVPPRVIEIQVSPTERKNVMLGRVTLPGVSGELEIHINGGDKPGQMPYVMVFGFTKQKDSPKVKSLVDKTRAWLKAHSLYRGQAIKLSFEWIRQGHCFDMLRDGPQFLDVSNYDASTLIFTPDVINKLQRGLWAPIMMPDACKEAGVPLKRGVLLESSFGMGKTLTAYVTANLATKAGWTVVYLASVFDLPEGLKFALNHLPALVFVEDVDRTWGSQERNEYIDGMLNTLDGIDSKGKEFITLFTTNNKDVIHKAFRRPGRIDTMISLAPPDAEAAGRLLQLYGGNLLQKEFQFDAVTGYLAGRSPAMIRETIELSKLGAIVRTGGVLEGEIAASDVLEAIHSLDAYNIWAEGEKQLIEAPMTLAVHLPPGFTKAVQQGAPHDDEAYVALTGSNNHVA